MESYGGAGCLDCYREHCRQQTPSSVRVATTAPDRRLSLQRHGRTSARRSDHARRSCRLFIAGSFVIGLILVPCAMSAPVRPQSRGQQPQQIDPAVPTGTPFWHNPCGMQLTYDGSGGGAAAAATGVGQDMMMESESAFRREEEIIDGIIVSASQALMHTEQLAGPFVVETFHMDVKQLHDVWKDTTLVWLQQTKYMPKELDVPLDGSYLATLTFRDILLSTYVGLQNLAVGLEQVAWDHNRERLSFAKDFNDTTFKLRAVLCEISAAIYDTSEGSSEKSESYVSRDIMPVESRISPDNRSLRDWLILREYITSLQYVIETFEYIKSNR